MKHTIITAIVIMILIPLALSSSAIAEIVAEAVNEESASAETLVAEYYWGDGCPFCEVLKNKIVEEGWDELIDIEEIEIYYDDSNKDRFEEKLTECGVPANRGGVPMVYAQGECWVGADQAEIVLESMAMGESAPDQAADESQRNGQILGGSDENISPSAVVGITILIISIAGAGLVVFKVKK